MAPQRKPHSPVTPGAFDNWLTPGRFALLIASLIVVCFPQVIFGFETFWFRDFSGFSYPNAFYARESYWKGEVPLWNPLNFCGIPFLAQWNTLALYPPSLFYLLLPLSWSLGVFCLLHLWWGGMGMYYLARRWTANNLAAAVAGIVFGFNGMTWCALMWPSNEAGIAWMPWVVLAVELACSKSGRWIAIAALAGAMQVLAGSPEATMLTWVLAGFLALLSGIKKEISWLKLCLAFGAVLVLVLGLAAAQLLPFADLLAHSTRNSSFAISEEGQLWSIPVSGWANYLIPLFHNYRVFFGDSMYYQFGQYWVTSYYLGIGTVLLALLALWWARREARTWLLSALACFCVLLAMGESAPIYGVVLKFFPLLGFMRYPVKFLTLVTLILPLLAAIGLAKMQQQPGTLWKKPTAWACGFVLTAVALALWLAWQHPTVNEVPSRTAWNAISRLAWLAGIVACLIFSRTATSNRSAIIGRVCLILLFWFDIFTQSAQLSPSLPRQLYEAGQVRKYEHWEDQLQPGQSRVMLSQKAYDWIYHRGGTNVELDFSLRRIMLFVDRNLLENIAKTDGFFSLELKEPHELLTAMATPSVPGRLADFLGVAYASDVTNLAEWTPRSSSHPVITAGQQPVFLNDASVLRGLADGDLDPTKNVYLPPDAANRVKAKDAAAAKVISQQFAPQQLQATVESPTPSWVVVAQAYYHPWRAFVDGQPTPLWRANYAFQALEIPAGRHEVRLVYADRMFETGVAISIASLLACAGLWFLNKRPETSA